MVIKIYKGLLIHEEYGDCTAALWLKGTDDPLLRIIQDDIDDYGKYLSIRLFFIDGDNAISIIDTEDWGYVEEEYYKHLIGVGDAEFQSIYSEYTGYLWTDENFHVGGHDVADILESHVGMYLFMQIEFNKRPKTC